MLWSRSVGIKVDLGVRRFIPGIRHLPPFPLLKQAGYGLKCVPPKRLRSSSPVPVNMTLFGNSLQIFPGGSDGKESASNAGDPSSIPGLGRSPGEGNSNALQYSCLGNPMDRGAWRVTVHGVGKSQIRLSD